MKMTVMIDQFMLLLVIWLLGTTTPKGHAATGQATEAVDGQCADKYFLCGEDKTSCVHQSLQCDGKDDCDNSADEAASLCYDSSYKTKDAAILIKSYGLRNITCNECELAEFPEQCDKCCGSELYCSDAGLYVADFMSRLSGNLTRLRLIDGSIASMPAKVFADHPSLNYISLRYNSIETIEPYAFANLSKLRTLLLNGNRLQTLPRRSLFGMENVDFLHLGYNYLGNLHMDLDVFEDVPRLSHLDLSVNKLTLKDQSFPKLLHLTTLFLMENNIEILTDRLFENLPALRNLELGENRIVAVHPKAFAKMTRLTKLNLSSNKIKFLHESTFEHLMSLETLHLDRNDMTSLAPRLFQATIQISFLSLTEIDIDNIDMFMFNRMRSLNKTFFKRFHYCSFVPHSLVCEPRTDGVSSMEDLLAMPVLRWSVWLMACVIFLSNAVVLFSRLVTYEENKVWGVHIRNLAAADFLMCFHLFVIGLQDQEYRGRYIQHANDWMLSDTCTTSGVIAMISYETSVLIVCFITIERYVCIAHPLARGQGLSRGTAVVCMTALWTIGVTVAVLPLFFWRTHEFYGSNGMCFPLHIADPYVRGWKYTAFLFLVVNCAAVLLIGIVYAAMFVSIRNTRNATSLRPQKDFAFRFFFIVFTDIVCLTPIIVLRWLSINDVHISADVYAWIVVFIMPINSAINPIMYTFTTRKFRKMMHDSVKSMPSIVRCQTAAKNGTNTVQTGKLFSSLRNGSDNDRKNAAGDCQTIPEEDKRQGEASLANGSERANRNSGVSEDTAVSIVSDLSDRNVVLLNESTL